jgi:hypothetical protein
MNTIKNSVEEVTATIITKIRDFLTPILNKYTAYYKYLQFFIYGTYALILLGFYNTVPQYIPTLRNIILYIAVFILFLRFNALSWNNPKFALLGGNVFSDFDRRLIISTCSFILITHLVSEAVIEHAKQQLQKKLIIPVVHNIGGGVPSQRSVA